MTITEGAQRIRGLAGSGKTVILSIKAARLHRKYPQAKIAYVFSTHSLYKQVTELVNKYYGKLTGEKLNPENLQVIHAWGGKTTGAGFTIMFVNQMGFNHWLLGIYYSIRINLKRPVSVCWITI